MIISGPVSASKKFSLQKIPEILLKLPGFYHHNTGLPKTYLKAIRNDKD